MFLSPLVLFAQQNGGAWINIGSSPAAVQAIAVDPRGTGTVFMGTIEGGVRKSVDGGITWSAANTGLAGLEVVTLAMDASGPDTIYAGSGGGLSNTTDGHQTVCARHRIQLREVMRERRASMYRSTRALSDASGASRRYWSRSVRAGRKRFVRM